jgi:hypothetical protein
MSLSFQPILKNANMENATPNASQNVPAGQPELPRTLDLMDLGQLYADRWGVHNVEMQHTHFPSTEDAGCGTSRRGSRGRNRRCRTSTSSSAT